MIVSNKKQFIFLLDQVIQSWKKKATVPVECNEQQGSSTSQLIKRITSFQK
jgi:hypothetical protein